jgi:hypothetical protein
MHPVWYINTDPWDTGNAHLKVPVLKEGAFDSQFSLPASFYYIFAGHVTACRTQGMLAAWQQQPI